MFSTTKNFSLGFGFVFFLLVNFNPIIFAQTSKEKTVTTLQPEKTIERELAGGQTHKYSFEAKANEFLQIKVEQKGVDVVVKLFDKDGKQLTEIDSPNGTQGFEIVTVIIADTGVYTVEIGSLEANAEKGNYTIFLETPRIATEKDKETLHKEKKTLQAKTIYNEAKALFDQGTAESYRAAREKFIEASYLYKEIGDKSNAGILLLAAGATSKYLGEKRPALEYSNEALLLFRAIPIKTLEALTLNGIGSIYIDSGENQKALEFLNQSLALSREIRDKSGEVLTLNNIGSIYANLDENQKALEFLNQSLALSREVQDKNNESTILNNIGEIYYNLGEKQKALDYYNQSLTITSTKGLKRGEATTLSNIGKLYDDWGEKRKALEYYNQSLSLQRAIGYKSGEATTLNNIGLIYSDFGENQKASEFFNQSLSLFHIIDQKSGEALIFSNLMHFWKSLNNPSQAILYGKQSVNVYQQLRSNIKGLDKSIQQTYLKSIESIYRSLADIMIAEGRFSEAQAVLDLLKEEEFDQLTRRGGEPLFILPYSRAEEEALKVIERLAAAGRELGDLKAKGGKLSEAEKKRLNELEQTEIPAANKALRLAIEALAKAAPDVEKTLAARMKDNIQNILPALGRGTVALYTVVGKTKPDEKPNKTGDEEINVGWILLVTPEFRKAYPIDTKDLEQTVFNFLNELRSRGLNHQPLAQELYRKLFLQTSDKQKTTLAADLETYLGKHKDKTLMWSLDNFLRYVPVAALHDGKGYLVEKYRNVVFNTASLGSLKDAVKPNWEVVGLGLSEKKTVKTSDGRTVDFAALEAAEKELRSLVKEKGSQDADGILPGVLKINKDFTRQVLFDNSRNDATVIHIASHFYFNWADEKTSFLLLGDGEQIRLTEFQDYPNLFQTIDLLSLAACDTAKGGNSGASDGKEVEGFAYVAQTLGAKSVMASLWQISDTGTKELMLKFYETRQANLKLPKGEALRQAQLSLLKNEKYAHPYFWSPFILIGNWK